MGVTSSGSCGPALNLPFTYGRINMLDPHIHIKISGQNDNSFGGTDTFIFRISTTVEKLKAGIRVNIIVFILRRAYRQTSHEPNVSRCLLHHGKSHAYT